jgi:uroporphyrinogen-III decarboxylase
MNATPQGDRMTPKERMAAFAAGREIDRIPCSPMYGEHACRLIGVTVSEYSHSAELLAKAPLDTPPENVIALMDAARIYGRWPIDPERLES